MVKQCDICGMTFEGSNNARYCCQECKKKAQIQRQKEYKAKRKIQKDLKARQSTVLDNNAKNAKRQGLSYGKMKAQEFARTIKVERPKKLDDYKHRKQQFDEIVEQNLANAN
ncbi:MAG: hypothetical protein IKW81_06285 [Pseudobutyrivibrio sp.]|nr:hypothetical protein [Pseudobutyrivibrio sp.]